MTNLAKVNKSNAFLRNRHASETYSVGNLVHQSGDVRIIENTLFAITIFIIARSGDDGLYARLTENECSSIFGNENPRSI